MAIRANSYGDTGEVGVMCPLYATATGSTFDTTTLPTLLQVESMVDQVSSVVNVLLAEAGFAIPVSQADAKLALDLFVNQEAAWYAEYANGAGPFVPTAMEMRTPSPQRMVLKDAEAFIGEHADGLEALGATRTRSLTYGLTCRTEDAAGNALVPPFSVRQVGHDIPIWDNEN